MQLTGTSKDLSRLTPAKGRSNRAIPAGSNPTSDKSQITNTDASALAKSMVQVTIGQWSLIAALIFGGCCSNVFTLEAIVK